MEEWLDRGEKRQNPHQFKTLVSAGEEKVFTKKILGSKPRICGPVHLQAGNVSRKRKRETGTFKLPSHVRGLYKGNNPPVVPRGFRTRTSMEVVKIHQYLGLAFEKEPALVLLNRVRKNRKIQMGRKKTDNKRGKPW